MRVRDVMTTPVRQIDRDMSVLKAVEAMSRYGVGALPVTDGAGILVGIVTDRDIVLHCVRQQLPLETTPVGEIMTEAPASVSPEDSVDAAAWIFMGRRIQRLPVIERGRAIGMVTLDDICRLWNDDKEIIRTVRRVAPRNRTVQERAA